MNRNQSVCFNCVYSGNCAFESQSAEPILHCEEHFIESANEKPFVEDREQSKTKNYLGLCSSCDFKDICSLRSENKIIINCEHYQ